MAPGLAERIQGALTLAPESGAIEFKGSCTPGGSWRTPWAKLRAPSRMQASERKRRWR